MGWKRGTGWGPGDGGEWEGEGVPCNQANTSARLQPATNRAGLREPGLCLCCTMLARFGGDAVEHARMH